MEEHVVKIISIEPVTHNVKHFRVEKPAGYTFVPGQATEVAVNKPRWETERRPFTFTSLNEWDHLEFTIKIYSDHDGVTNQLGQLKAGDELLLHDVWGAIQYKGEGFFIAGVAPAWLDSLQSLGNCRKTASWATISSSFQIKLIRI